MEPPIQARCLKVCREVIYDPHDEEAPYSLRAVISHLRPHDDLGYPLCMESLMVYVELFGEPGRHLTRVVVVLIDPSEEVPDQVVATFDWKPARVRPGLFVDGAKFQLMQIPFDIPGLYEFRFMLDGYEDPLIAERIQLMEV